MNIPVENKINNMRDSINTYSKDNVSDNMYSLPNHNVTQVNNNMNNNNIITNKMKVNKESYTYTHGKKRHNNFFSYDLIKPKGE